MKLYTSILVLVLALVFSACSSATDKVGDKETVAVAKTPKNKKKKQQGKVGPWAANQIMEPAELAAKINDGSVTSLKVYSIGPSALIPNSANMGNMKSANNQKKFKEELRKLDKDEEILVYCGCCPFRNCPNFKPAYRALNEMGFTNFKLLNLKQNIKTDWIDKGYPTVD